SAGVVPPLDPVLDVYVDVRTWASRSGHGLAAKDHDRWVAAVAMAADLPLATEDTIFDGVPALSRLSPPSA
ncbi:MAG: type II toxin-antitoxin system VapC family toxin, partial [bacterium]|nr:type II toxin-antitoxin system VapC family toxin [bacterium]